MPKEKYTRHNESLSYIGENKKIVINDSKARLQLEN